MRELGRLSGNIPKKNRIAHEIARVCGFRLGRKGSTNPFRQFNETLHRIVIAGEVHMALTQTEKLDYAYDLVVREHPARCQKLHGSAGCVRISRRTVMRHYQQYRHTIPSTRKSRR
jgi:hypothetical protein